ncbi:enoyl-CoA hydratase/isomerase family protein [Jannaschia seohaensis]|uniref:3-hydroxyisobutyryl-CoA hydrolase n=1 Tax=Jannaschia seohaensis TaxID=475081 RepID=A0A2Y9AAB0_9RHOB|nr:enoyl-CoA hydratase/isomerase family protein [Jannaschia seohaensis]PWJ21091.1 enoyl-CoA hydratase [Jannaschia seohaensis]SSA41501.1 enoyl-CoA hydratase [Jannaschia seohaensis]
MTEIDIRQDGRAGRITLNRPDVLNALSWEMCLAIEAALDGWAEAPGIDLVLIEGAPGRAFCAGGDILEMHKAGTEGRYEYGQRFWRDEYRMNAKMFRFPKPVVSFLHGFTMGGGVGVGCHASHRIVNESSRIAMPECAIGLVPDVGGSLILARAPGRLGEYLGTTGMRMGPGDAIHAGFADLYVPECWDDLKARLCESGDVGLADAAGVTPPEAPLATMAQEIDALFGGETLGDIARACAASESEVAQGAMKALRANSPLSMACTVEMLHRLGDDPTIDQALLLEYRFTHRALEHADFVEGIRAQIVDKDRTPRWRHAGPDQVPPIDVSAMLRPLPKDTPLPEVTP